MELVKIESSQIVYLTQVHRPSGQLYVPDFVTTIEERYSFKKGPSPEFESPMKFAIGKFDDVQINEFAIYNDGFIASSASDTDLLNAFIEDLMLWVREEFGLIQSHSPTSQKFYESTIVVKSTYDLALSLAPQNDITTLLADALKVVKIGAPIKLTGFLFDFDPTDFAGKRKPFRIIIERRVGVPFSENLFFSQAPLQTKVHLNFLRSLEAMLLPRSPEPTQPSVGSARRRTSSR